MMYNIQRGASCQAVVDLRREGLPVGSLLPVEQADVLVKIIQDIADASNSEEFNHRLLESLRQAIPFDAAALLRLERDALVPEAISGLSRKTFGRRFLLREHPGLETICRSQETVLFQKESTLPDPLPDTPAAVGLGLPLNVRGEPLGVLWAVAADPAAFENIDPLLLKAVAALAAAEMRPHVPEEMSTTRPMAGAVRGFQRTLIRQALAENGDRWAAAARALGMDRGNLHHLATRLGIERTGRRRTPAPRREGLPPPPEILL